MSTLNCIANQDRLIGRYIDDKYLIESLVSNGVRSRIYKASWGDRPIALKILHLDCTSDPELAEQFLRQVQLATCIQTKKALRILGYGIDFFPVDHSSSDRQMPYIVSEFCDFPSLVDRTYEPTAAVNLVLEILRSLQSYYAGSYLRSESGSIISPLRFWHHNLKPSNVFLGDLYPLLADYGTHHLLAFPDLDWQYAAPEDWQADLPRDQRRDIYGCGLILYEILSGVPAHPLQEGIRAWQQTIAHQPILGFSKKLNIPRELELITLRCLEKHPQHRYQHLKELQQALQQFNQVNQVQPSSSSIPKRSPRIFPILLASPLAFIPLTLFLLRQSPPTTLQETPKPQPLPQPPAQTKTKPQPLPPIPVAKRPQPITPPPAQTKTKPQPLPPIPVAKRPQPITPPPFSPPPPLPQPQTPLIPPPSIFEVQDSSKIKLLLNLSDSPRPNFKEVIDRSAELAGHSISQAFNRNPQRQEVEIAIIGSRNGLEVPLLLAKVSRNQWQSDPNINRWANYILKAESLLQ